jgi:hypothetical protein
MYGIYGDTKYRDYPEDLRPLIAHGHHYARTFPTLMRPLDVKNSAEKAL